MHITFQIKSSKIDSTGKAPIYARITIDGKRKEFSIKRSIEPIKWIKQAGLVKGTSEEARSINAFLNTIRLKLYEHERVFIEKGETITAEGMLNAYYGIKEKGRTIIEAFEQHNNRMQSLLNKDYSPGTYERYCTALKHLKEFITLTYGKADIELVEINYGFVTAFEHYLKVKRNCGHNTALKYITNFKKIVRICIAYGWIKLDPFLNYKIRLQEVRKDILTMGEIELVMKKQFASGRLKQVRDIFIFCCFTGLAYSDVKKLSKDHLLIGVDGNMWIKVFRTKTDSLSSIPLLTPALNIIERYKTHPLCTTSGKLLPVLSNQKMNDYIKEIISICDINKNVSCHTARHTFATTIMLNHNMPLESISKLLGHRSVAITQQYARIMDGKISQDMTSIRSLLEKYSI